MGEAGGTGDPRSEDLRAGSDLSGVPLPPSHLSRELRLRCCGGSLSGTRKRSRAGPGRRPLAVGFTYALLCGPKDALSRPGPFVCEEDVDKAAWLLGALNMSQGLKRGRQPSGGKAVATWLPAGPELQ